MPVIIPCIKCQRKLRVQERLVGKLVKCPGCQTKFLAQPAAAPAAAVIPAAAVASPAPAAPRPAAPAPPPSSRQSLAPAVAPPRAAPPPPTPRSSPRVQAVAAGPPAEEITIEHRDDGITPPPASSPPRELAPEDDFEEPSPPKRKPVAVPARPSSFLGVFVTLGFILLLTTIVGMVCGWWVNASVKSLRSGVVPNQPQQKKAGPAQK